MPHVPVVLVKKKVDELVAREVLQRLPRHQHEALLRLSAFRPLIADLEDPPVRAVVDLDVVAVAFVACRTSR